jgi:hypothetical protein
MTMQRYQLRCHRRGHSPFTWDVIAHHPGQAVKIAAFTWPHHLFTFVDHLDDTAMFLA